MNNYDSQEKIIILFKMDTLSMEPIYGIALNLDPYTLSQLCLTDKRYSSLCNDEYFWKTKFQIDYSGFVAVKPESLSWKEYYQSHYTNVLIMIRADSYYFGLIDYRILPKRLADHILKYFDDDHSINLSTTKYEGEEYSLDNKNIKISTKDKPSDLNCFRQLFGESLQTIEIIDNILEQYLDILADDEDTQTEANELELLLKTYTKII